MLQAMRQNTKVILWITVVALAGSAARSPASSSAQRT